MTHRIDPTSKGVPYSKIGEPPKKETPVDKVATEVFAQVKQKKAPKSTWDFIFSPIAGIKHLVLKSFLDEIDGEQDRKVLRAIFGNTSTLDREIEQHAPFIREFVTELLLSKKHGLGDVFQENQAETEEFLDHLVHHLILSAALKTLPPDLQKKVKNGEPLQELLNVEDVIGKFIKQALEVFGKDLNEIDRQAMKGKPLDAKLIRPFVENFYEYLFPEDDSFHKLVDAVSRWITLKDRVPDLFSLEFRSFKEKKLDDVANKFGGLYQPYFDRLQGKKAAKKEPTQPLPGEKESIEWMGRFFIRSVASSSKKEDIAFLKSKGIEDPERLIKQMSPTLSQNLLKFLPFTQNQENGAMLDQTAEAMILHAIVSVAKASGKDRLDHDTLLEDVFSHLSGMMREGINSVDPSKMVDPASFSTTSLKIMSMFIPPDNEWALEFLQRRNIGEKSSLNQFMFQMYKATAGEKEVKKRLLARIGSQEGANLLETLCNTIAGTSLVKIQEFLSKPENIDRLLKGESTDAALLISGIISSKDPNLQWFRDTGAKAGGSVLLKGLTNFLEKIPKEKGERLEDLCFASFETLLKSATDHLPEASAQLRAKNEEEGANILLSFTKELTSFFYSPEKLESQGTFAGLAFEKVQEQVAKELVKVVTYSNNLLAHKEENQKRLETLYGSENPSKMGDLLGHVALQVIPSQLNAYGPERAKNVVDKLASYIPMDESQQKSTSEGISRALNKIGSEKLLENTGTLEFISQFSESAFLQFFLHFSEGIQKLENQGERPLFEEIALLGLDGLSTHFKNLGEAKEALKGQKDIKSEDILNQYKEKNVQAPEINDPAAKDAFYKKLTSQLFMLFETDLKKELPEIAANAIEEIIVPSLLADAVTQALSPETLHLVLSNLLEKASNASEKDKEISFAKLFPKSKDIKARLAKREERELLSKEEYHKEITEVMSELIKNAVYLQPSDIVRGIGERKGLRKAAATGIADFICTILREGGADESQALFLMNKALGFILDEAFPSEKNPETGKYEYGDRDKTITDEDKDKVKLLPESKTSSPNLPFIAKTVEEKEKLEKKKKEDIKTAEKNVPKFLRAHIHRITSAFVLDVFFRSWDKLEEKIKSALPILSKAIIPVLDFFIKAPLFIVLFVFNLLLSVLTRAVVRVLFHESAEKLADNIKYATPENYVYDLVKKVMKDVDKRRAKI